MEAASTSETSVNFYQITRRNNRDDSHLQDHVCLISWINWHTTSVYTYEYPQVYTLYIKIQQYNSIYNSYIYIFQLLV
jgi:hypothetical protein